MFNVLAYFFLIIFMAFFGFYKNDGVYTFGGGREGFWKKYHLYTCEKLTFFDDPLSEDFLQI